MRAMLKRWGEWLRRELKKASVVGVIKEIKDDRVTVEMYSIPLGTSSVPGIANGDYAPPDTVIHRSRLIGPLQVGADIIEIQGTDTYEVLQT